MANDNLGALKIEAGFEIGLTYPGIVEPDRMLAEPGQSFHDLAQVPARHGGMADLTRMPAGEAEDVVQETYVRAFTHLEQFRGDSSLSTWLSRIDVRRIK